MYLKMLKKEKIFSSKNEKEGYLLIWFWGRFYKGLKIMCKSIRSLKIIWKANHSITRKNRIIIC